MNINEHRRQTHNDESEQKTQFKKQSTNYCGFVALVGRPNVGKSTLLNHLLGQKLSITSRKPQTTRNRILGIKTKDQYQILYMDTPGIHQKTPQALNRRMNKAVLSALEDVNVVLFIVDGLVWNAGDVFALEAIKKSKKPTLLVINKIDQVKMKAQLALHVETLKKQYNFKQVLLVSAKHGTGLETLEHAICELLPENPHLFGEDEITNVSERFIASEFIREKLIRTLGQELPYATAVSIEKFKYENKILHIHANIWVDREGQKGIVIGDKGEKLKKIGSLARLDIENFFECKAFLQLWVKVKSGWGNNERLLQTWGI